MWEVKGMARAIVDPSNAPPQAQECITKTEGSQWWPVSMETSNIFVTRGPQVAQNTAGER